MPHLEIRKRNRRRVERVELTDHSLTIGRSALNGVVLHDAAVSRCHCVIETIAGTARILDVGSREGIRVNRRRRREARLTDGDRISIGAYELTYHDASEGRAGPAAMPACSRADSTADESTALGAAAPAPPAPSGDAQPSDATCAAQAIRRAEVLAERLDASERAWAEAEAALRAADAAQRAQQSASVQAAVRLGAANERLEQEIARLTAECDRLRRDRDALAAELRRARGTAPSCAESSGAHAEGAEGEASSVPAVDRTEARPPSSILALLSQPRAETAEPSPPGDAAHAGPLLIGLLRGERREARPRVPDRDWGTWLVTAAIAILSLAALAAIAIVGRFVR